MSFRVSLHTPGPHPDRLSVEFPGGDMSPDPSADRPDSKGRNKSASPLSIRIPQGSPQRLSPSLKTITTVNPHFGLISISPNDYLDRATQEIRQKNLSHANVPSFLLQRYFPSPDEGRKAPPSHKPAPKPPISHSISSPELGRLKRSRGIDVFSSKAVSLQELHALAKLKGAEVPPSEEENSDDDRPPSSSASGSVHSPSNEQLMVESFGGEVRKDMFECELDEPGQRFPGQRLFLVEGVEMSNEQLASYLKVSKEKITLVRSPTINIPITENYLKRGHFYTCIYRKDFEKA